jgi:phospholipid-translocating ATPase
MKFMYLMTVSLFYLQMNASGVIESVPSVLGSNSQANINVVSSHSHGDGNPSSITSKQSVSMAVRSSQTDKYSRLPESRSVTPSPPPPHAHSYPPQTSVNIPPSDATPFGRRALNCSGSGKPSVEFPHQPILSPINSSSETTPTTESPPLSQVAKQISRPKLLNVPSLLLVGSSKKSSSSKAGNSQNSQQRSATPSPCELKPIFEAESPDELALVDAAYSYNCRLVKRAPQFVTVSLPGWCIVTHGQNNAECSWHWLRYKECNNW